MAGNTDVNLGDLGVSIESQSSFEQRVLAKAAAAAAEAEAEAANRLKEQRGLLLNNIDAVKKKLKSPAYSATLQQEMLTSQLKILEKKLEDLDRAANRAQDASSVLERGPSREEETERERLIRTGFITPFSGIDGSEKERLRITEASVVRAQARRQTREGERIASVVEARPDHRASTGRIASRRDAEPPNAARRDKVALPRSDKVRRKRSRLPQNVDADDGDEEAFQERIVALEERKKRRRSRDSETRTAEDRGSDGAGASDVSSESDEEDVQFSGGFCVPRSIYDRLFPYQRTAVKWMWELHCQEAGGIVGDEMGLGKTVQTVAFLAGLHRSDMLPGPVLLLCPATIMAQWVRHFHEWYPPLRVVVVHDSGSHARAAEGGAGRRRSAERLVKEAFRRGGVVVTTYDHLRIHADLMTGQVPHPAVRAVWERRRVGWGSWAM
jgi:DNA excision repair protein ERCC-6